MIGNVSPGLSSCEHTLNTLRYSDRVKELKKGNNKDQSNPLMLPRQNSNIVKYNDEPKVMNLLYKKSGEEGKIKSKGLLSPHNTNLKSCDSNRENINQKHSNLIQEILEKEDDLVNNHSHSVNETPDIMNYELQILADVQEPNSDMGDYLKKLDKVLEYKETIIASLRNKIVAIQHQLKEENSLNLLLNSRKNAMDVFDLDNDDFFENVPL